MADPRPVLRTKSTSSQVDGLMPYVDQLIANYYAFMARLAEPQTRPARPED